MTKHAVSDVFELARIAALRSGLEPTLCQDAQNACLLSAASQVAAEPEAKAAATKGIANLPRIPQASLGTSFAELPGSGPCALFQSLVAGVCRSLQVGKSLVECLKDVPEELEIWKSMTWMTCLEDFKHGLQDVKQDSIECRNEIEIFLPMWRTMPLQLAVVFEVLSRVVALPVVMLWDAWKVVWSSILNKDLAVAWGNYSLRQRYWAVITSDPGAGKSPALSLIMECLMEAMKDDACAGLFAGYQEDNFHAVNDSTHAAFAARLNRADGYALLASPEASTSLCPKFPLSGEFNKATHVDLERALEGSTGGGIHWDTQADVLSRARNARKQEQVPDKGVHHDSTNISFLFFQQISMLQSWWAQSEARWKKGLTNRFLFSAGRRPVECQVADGLVDSIKSYLVDMLKWCARNFGYAHRPRAPVHLPSAAREALKEARAIAGMLAQEKLHGDHGALRTMLEKVAPWLTHESLANSIMKQASACVTDSLLKGENPLSPMSTAFSIDENCCKMALQFIYLRLASWRGIFL